jgi:hypothetical protein
LREFFISLENYTILVSLLVNQQMKVSFLICLFSLWIFDCCTPDKPREILFIGNSLTYYHDMPATLQKIFNEKKIKINVHQSTLPGVSLADHLVNPQTLKKIEGQNWDVVILQEGTVRILIPEARKYKFERSVFKFDSIIKLKGGKTILYQSYPISIYPEKYCYPSLLISNTIPEREYCSDELKDSDQEFRIIEDAFNKLSKQIDCDIAQVGLFFEICKRKYPELALFESVEDTHPSALGSYLIACVFFKELTGEKASKISYSAGLNELDVEKVREVVDSQ